WSSVPARRSHYRTGSNGSVLKVRLAALDVLDDLRLGVLVDGGEDPRRVLAGLRCALADGDNGALADDVLGRADQGDLLDLGAVDHVVRHAGVQREVGVEDRDVGRDLVLRAVVRRGDLAVEALRLQQQGLGVLEFRRLEELAATEVGNNLETHCGDTPLLWVWVGRADGQPWEASRKQIGWTHCDRLSPPAGSRRGPWPGLQWAASRPCCRARAAGPGAWSWRPGPYRAGSARGPRAAPQPAPRRLRQWAGPLP